MYDYSQILTEIIGKYGVHSKWDDAPFRRIKAIPNTSVGSVGQDFIERLCGESGIRCRFPVDGEGNRLNQSSWDIAIDAIQFELKTATEDVGGHFQFNHIRYHRKYDALLCLGISPASIFFGVWSKGDVTTGKAGSLVSMEKGAAASYKLTKMPGQLHPISEFADRIKRFVGDNQI